MSSQNKGLFSDKIVQKDWIQLHPLKLHSTTDFYYIQLSNKIFTLLLKDKTVNEFPTSLKRQFALTATAYFEDVISKIGLWSAIRKIHFEKHGKYIPFIDTTDEYQLDEINLEDVQFLIWTIFQRDVLECDELRFINIENPLLRYVSLIVYGVLDAEYETAPENETLYNAVHSANLATDYFLFREFLKWLHYDSYLSEEYPENEVRNEIEDLKKTKNQEYFYENKDALKYTLVHSLIFTSPCSPMAILSSKWLAEIVSDSKVKDIARAIAYRRFNNYRITGIDSKTIKVQLLDGDTDILELDINSLNSTKGIKDKTTISCAMTWFDGIWNVNGMASFGDIDEDDNLKDSINNVAIEKKEDDKLTYDFVLKNNNNSPIAYFRDTKELSVFLLKLFPNSSKSELIPSNMTGNTNIVIFTHPKLGLIMFPDLAKWIKDKNNPCYNQKSASDHAVSILCGGYSCQREFLEYVIQNNLIPDARINSLNGEDYGRKLVQQNLDFIIRFFQPELFSVKVD